MYLTIRKPILVRKIRKSESDAHLRVDGGVAVGTIRVVEKPAPRRHRGDDEHGVGVGDEVRWAPS
jgi:hypothetical protein